MKILLSDVLFAVSFVGVVHLPTSGGDLLVLRVHPCWLSRNNLDVKYVRCCLARWARRARESLQIIYDFDSSSGIV